MVIFKLLMVSTSEQLYWRNGMDMKNFNLYNIIKKVLQFRCYNKVKVLFSLDVIIKNMYFIKAKEKSAMENILKNFN